MSTRLRLRRADGRLYLQRWGWEWKKLGGIFIHCMTAPDPGIDLHDHPFTFWSLILSGGYIEERLPTRDACGYAGYAEHIESKFGASCSRGPKSARKRWSLKCMRLDECHRITQLKKKTWTIVIHGPNRRAWGFYLPTGWVDEKTYDQTVRAERRDLFEEK